MDAPRAAVRDELVERVHEGSIDSSQAADEAEGLTKFVLEDHAFFRSSRQSRITGEVTAVIATKVAELAQAAPATPIGP